MSHSVASSSLVTAGEPSFFSHLNVLDASANKSAIQQCNEVLKKYLAKVWAYACFVDGWTYAFVGPVSPGDGAHEQGQGDCAAVH